MYCDKWDVYYGEDNQWLEFPCGDPECEFCSRRPSEHAEDCQCSKDETDCDE